ncbi:Alpha/Beta hydrolase protein [Bipolaris maydis]|nr:Alpha/Beta hydrolase protein [Bipolaris maydis]
MRISTLSLFGLQAALGHAQESCNAACQAAFRPAVAAEIGSMVSKNVSSEPFYSTPANVTGAKPEDFPQSIVNTNNFTIPSGMSLSRFLYMTEDIDRKPIPASGFVLLPYSRPDPSKPLNTIVWAHDLYYEWQGPYYLAQAGYAVIAPDYAGQGSDIPQGFMYEAGFLHAADVAYSLVAARKVIGNLLSQDYVVIGHSEGGMTAWRTNERLGMPNQDELKRAGNFLGSVANSPALRPLDLISESVRRANGGPIGDAVSVFFLQSLAGLFPKEFRIEDHLTSLALARVPLVNQGCIFAGRSLFAGLTGAQLFKSLDWLKLPVVVDWQKRFSGAGPHALAAPMLVVQGITDALTYANNTEWDFNQTCSSFPNTKATLLLYPDSNHDVTNNAAIVDSMRWIQDRFNGVPVEDGCHKKTIQTLTTRLRNINTSYNGTA